MIELIRNPTFDEFSIYIETFKPNKIYCWSWSEKKPLYFDIEYLENNKIRYKSGIYEIEIFEKSLIDFHKKFIGAQSAQYYLDSEIEDINTFLKYIFIELCMNMQDINKLELFKILSKMNKNTFTHEALKLIKNTIYKIDKL